MSARDCDCGGSGSPSAAMENPPGQRVLSRRSTVHAAALAQMRRSLGDPGHALALRALANQQADDPSIALLDSWAVVADVVAFYNERIATEGFLRTATERLSVRELARTLGYELRPGVAAQAELAFTAEMAASAPAVVDVPAGTPVQSIPSKGQLPQIFETSEVLEVRGVWNKIPAAAWQPQEFEFGESHIWLRGTSTQVGVGSRILIVGDERARFRSRSDALLRREGTLGDRSGDDEKWEFRRITAVTVEPPGFEGWIRLDLDHPIGYRRTRPLTAQENVRAYLLTERTNLFGWNAPDPSLMVNKDGKVPGATPESNPGEGKAPIFHWDNYDAVDPDYPDVVELDGDRPSVVAGSWLVMEQPGKTESFLVLKTQAAGGARFGLSGKWTRVRVDVTENLAAFTRPQTLVHAGSVPIPAEEMPVQQAVGAGSTIQVELTDPPLPRNRMILVSGPDALSGERVTEPAIVLDCTVLSDGRRMALTLDRDLQHSYAATQTSVFANVVTATHGETTSQVLGSGDGTEAFPQFALRRSPLTYARSQTPDGATAALSVRVDGVEWQLLSSLEAATPTSRAYTLRHGEDGQVKLVFGDGVHGARLPTGGENVVSTYRVGIGETGAMEPDQLSMLSRRPLGIRGVTNLADSHDWSPEESLEAARVNAPLRVRTLDRAVSVADYQDFAAGYAGVGKARADLVWDGQRNVVVVSLLATGARAPSTDLLRDLQVTVDASRDLSAALVLKPGDVLWFGIRLELEHDPAYERDRVEADVAAALQASLAPAARDFATPVTASGVLVIVHDVPGVLACTMPRLLALPDPPSPDPALPPVLPPDPPSGSGVRDDILLARPARWAGGLLPAELIGLAAGGVEIKVMAP